MGDFVTVEKKSAIAMLVLNRPDQLNAIGHHSDCADLVSALQDINDDPAISVAILTGSGRAFSAGGNLQGMKDRNGIGPLDSPAATRANYRRGVQRIPLAFQDLEVPIIAAVNGHAIGVGCDLACLCDIRIASEQAKFAASFIRMGLIPGDGGAWILPRVVGYAKAAEMLFTGDVLTAEQALICGLVSQVTSPDVLLETALELAGRIARNPAKAIRMSKRILIDAQKSDLDQVLKMSASMQALAHETEDHVEAVNAFLEKRSPVFNGR